MALRLLTTRVTAIWQLRLQASTLGAASGAAGTVTVGDKLLIVQMQGAAIDTSNNERYGNGVGANARPDPSASQANGYTALNLAGGYEATPFQLCQQAGRSTLC